jgi:hypothetical protein
VLHSLAGLKTRHYNGELAGPSLRSG